MGEKDLRRAQIEQKAVEFSEKLAIENPGMYTIEEMQDFIERYEKTTAESDRAMREELTSMPPEMQQKMKELLKAGEIPEEVWKDIFGSEF